MILKRRRVDGDEVWLGAPGMVGALLRVAVEDACGQGAFRFKEAVNPQTEARDYLRSDAWEPLVDRCGADPGVIRAELERRFEWMRR